MARIDKYEPLGGGTRARLADDWGDEDMDQRDGIPLGVGLDVDGHVVPGAGNTGIIGVLVLVGANKKQGNVVDVMTGGEIVECEGLAAGSVIYADQSDGTLSDSGGAGMTPVGFTVEEDRLVVRVAADEPSGS